MFTKVVAFAAIIACARAGAPLAAPLAAAPVAYAAPHYFAGSVGASAEHTVRGFGGLSTVSQYSKSVASPFSSVHKHDTRITNDALHAYAAPAIAAPAYAHYAHAPYAAAPYAHHGAVGYAHSAPAYAAPIAHHAYAAPVAHAAPIAHHAYAAPAIAAAPLAAAPIAHHAYAAPVAHAHHAYAAPALAHGYAAPLAPAKSLSYSPVSPAVATLSYSTPFFNYGY